MILLRALLVELHQELALALGELLRGFHNNLDVEVAHVPERSTGMPLPLRRNCLPVWVPSGTFTRASVPPSVGTLNSPPSAAVTMEIGTRQNRSAPSRWKNGWA